MPSKTQALFDRAAAKVMDQYGEDSAAWLIGLGRMGADLKVPAIVGEVTADRETIDQGGSHEMRENVEGLTIELAERYGVTLSTSVVVPEYGEQPWTIERISGDTMIELALYRTAPTAKQRSRLERGTR